MTKAQHVKEMLNEIRRLRNQSYADVAAYLGYSTSRLYALMADYNDDFYGLVKAMLINTRRAELKRLTKLMEEK